MSVQLTNPAFNLTPTHPLAGSAVSTIVIDADGNGAVSGLLTGNTRQLFGLQITAGDTVTINANAVGVALDTILKVFLPDITTELNLPGANNDPTDPSVIAENDDVDMFTLNSSVTFTATVTGLHYVSVAPLVGNLANPLLDDSFALQVSGVTNPGTIGADTIVGGAFNDVYEAIAGADLISGGDGQDILLGGIGADIIYGNRDTDILSGGEGSDTIFAGQNNAVNADGTLAIDTVLNLATGGLRQVQVGGTESVFGGSGADVLYGNFGTDVLHGESGADTIFGGQGDDFTNGGSENDLLLGNRGNDSMMGNTGNDTLNGGSGNDSMQGNAGNDVFVFRAGSGSDVIEDFQAGVDVIQVSANLNGNLTTTAADYAARVSAAADGSAIINLGDSADGATNSINLVGVNSSAVTSDFFVFG
ncbi:MAG: calcium-binding protein [Alphaproteobacteria bacterium]|nr:calcium-binding protein [Alphaproteobacteria bacterium]